MVIAIGSYPIGRRFESHRRYHVAIRLCRAARFQGGAVHSLCAALPPQTGTAHPAENSFFSKSVRRLFEGKEISGPAPQISAENDRFCGLHTYGPMVKRLRHRPFTAVTRVRVPVGSPTKNTGNRLCFLLVAPSGAADPKGSREQAMPATPRRGDPACGVSADTRWGHERKKCADVGSRERAAIGRDALPRLPKGNGNEKHPTPRRLVAGKAPWQSARFACRLARSACRSSSQKSRSAAIFGSPVLSLAGFRRPVGQK